MIDSISFKLDDDGYLSRECPSCSKQFKILYGKGAEGAIQYCPYCDHVEKDCWLTTEQASYFESTVVSSAMTDINDAFKDALKDSKNITFTPGDNTEQPVRMPEETNNDWPIVEFKSTTRIKHDGSQEQLRCPVTGESLS